uniref:BTB domain-containing protein n=1 Tax=Macrostomum lignano TaxID=282301 RepID=A0A1I8IER9_9PLAT
LVINQCDFIELKSPPIPSSDVKFIIGSSRRPFYAHRCLVATNPDTFASVLEFLYTNCVCLRPSNALEVLAAAVEFGLDDLRRLCFDYLTDNLNSSNACELLQAAVTFGQEELRLKAAEFIERNAAAVFTAGRAFAGLSAEALAGILGSDQLMLDELDIIAALRSWANLAVERAATSSTAASANHRRSSVSFADTAASTAVVGSVALDDCPGLIAAVRQLRLGLLTPQELAEVERENEADLIIPVSFGVNCLVCQDCTRCQKSSRTVPTAQLVDALSICSLLQAVRS